MSAAAAAAAAAEELDCPWTEKHRPATLGDVRGHDDVVRALRRLLGSQGLPHLLFYGPPGTGKTSTILACARELYGGERHMRQMVLEINASDDNGIGTVRDTVSAFARTVPLFQTAVRVKLIVLDEAEHLTPEAQAALKRVLEQVSATARFCFVCNSAGSILPAIQSRCARFRFRPLSADAVRAKVDQVAAAEGVELMPGTQDALVRLGQGDLRRVLNTLQSCAFRSRAVAPQDVYAVSGQPSPVQMAAVVQAVTTLDMSAAHAQVMRVLREGGLSLADVVTELGECAARPSFALYAGAARPARVMCYLTTQLARAALALNDAAEDGVQAAAVVAAFVLARHLCRPALGPARAPEGQAGQGAPEGQGAPGGGPAGQGGQGAANGQEVGGAAK
jgi:replication factor C subunit 3/5